MKFYVYIAGITQPNIANWYFKSGFQRGHLNPVKINSFDEKHVQATFTYSNAVPQYGGLNGGAWKTFEGQIVDHVQKNCQDRKGTMYLMTGTSKFRIGKNGVCT